MKIAPRLLLPLPLFAITLILAGCAGEPTGIQNTHRAAAANIQSEAPGDYYIGRRYSRVPFKFWGYLRRPGQPWSTAQMVMMNEKQKLAPDRAINQLGSDNNYEYKIYGYYSGEEVYEPASNSIYPEFILKDYQLVSRTPPPIFKSQLTGRPSRVWIEKPE